MLPGHATCAQHNYAGFSTTPPDGPSGGAFIGDSMSDGQSDKEMAKALLEKLELVQRLEMELADVQSTLKVAQMNMLEWQDKHNKLLASITNRKVLGYHVTLLDNGQQQKVSSLLPFTEALVKLLSLAYAKRCVLIPVFASEPEETKLDDTGEDGDLVT